MRDQGSLVLIPPMAPLQWARRMNNNDEYEIDARGYRALIGLTIEETEELLRLDAILSVTSSYFAGVTLETEMTPDEVRWVELINKHDAAMKPFRHMRLIKH